MFRECCHTRLSFRSETGLIESLFILITDNMFYFTCFNVDDPDDPSVGLINGELAIPGNLLRREVFDPVVEEVSAHLDQK